MRVLALDLSKASAGWALYAPGDAQPASGAWTLGSAYTPPGRVYGRLHQEMSALHALGRIDAVFYEEPLDPRFLSGATNKETMAILYGLAAHAESWAEAMSCRIIRAVNQVTWRRHFFGAMKRPRGANGKPTKVDWKALAMDRCWQLGFRPNKHDQAEAIGILSYAASSIGIETAWSVEPGPAAIRLFTPRAAVGADEVLT